MRHSDRLVNNIINSRRIRVFDTSSDLLNVIHASGITSTNEIAKIFQSLRIEVNDEVHLVCSLFHLFSV